MSQGLAQNVSQSACLTEKRAGEFGKNGAIAIGLIQHLVTALVSQQQTGIGKLGEFSVQGACAGACQACKFAYMDYIVRVKKQPPSAR